MKSKIYLNNEGKIIIGNNLVELLPYEDRPAIDREFMTDNEIIQNAGSDLILDVESYPNYFMCGFKHPKLNKFICLEKNFSPQFLSWLLFNYRTVGFNSYDYDLEILWASFVNRDPIFLKEVSNALIQSGLRPKEIEKQFGFKSYETRHIDMIEVCPLKGSLKLYAARLHAARLQDLPYPDTKELTEDEINIVRNYNFNDLELTQLTYDFNKDRLDLRATMGIEYQEDLMSKSDAQIAEAVLTKEVRKLTGKWPRRPEIKEGTAYKYEVPPYIQYKTPKLQKLLYNVRTADFIVDHNGKIILPPNLDVDVKINKGVYRIGIGGLHSSEKNVSYIATDTHMIVDRDVASYYPRIITNLRLYPVGMGPDFLGAYEQIIARRLHAKKNKIFATDKGLKIVINGTSGKFSDFWSKMYSPDLTIQTTVTGQLALLLQIEMQELNGIECISANTDGAVYYVPVDRYELFNRTIKEWETRTNFETEETLYSGYYARDVNAYFAVKKNGEVKVKGNPYSEVGSQSGTQLDVNPVLLICSDAIKNLLSKNIPIQDTIKNCKDITRFVYVRNAKSPGAHKNGKYLGKVLRWYYAKGEIGGIYTVQTNNKVADSEGGKPIQDLPNTFPEDIDYEKYINITTDMLYDIGYLKRLRQIEFF